MRKLATVACLLALALLAGCVTTGEGVDNTVPIRPVVDPGARKAALAKLPPAERIRYCQSSVRRASLAVEARISGPVRRQNSTAQIAGTAILETVEAWYAGNQLASEVLRDTLAHGARIGAFTKILPYSPPEYPGYNPMNEPIYQVGNFMLAVAHGYAVLKEDYPEDTELLAAVRRWGDRLFEITSNSRDTFDGRSKGVDRRTLIAQGWAHWGNLTGNRKALGAAYRYYVHAVNSIGSGGTDSVWRYLFPSRILYYTNMTYGSAMVTAYALYRSGASDVYKIAPGGGTLVEGAAYYWESFLEKEPFDLMESRTWGSRSPAWTELFVREFPNHPAAAKMASWLSKDSWVPKYAYTSGGGPSTCLYRRIPPQPRTAASMLTPPAE